MAVFTQFTLQCVFTVLNTGAPFLTTTTDLTENKEIGTYTHATFIGGAQGSAENILLNEPSYLYAFELNEGPSDQNIKIYVNHDMTALAHNPRDPISGKQRGTCTIQ